MTSEYICELVDPRYEMEWVIIEEIVRCRDYMKFYKGDTDYATDDWCQEFNCQIESDGFCAWGEKK